MKRDYFPNIASLFAAYEAGTASAEAARADSKIRPARSIPKVTCIIPAYDEETRIAGVLRAVEGHPWIDEIVVVVEGTDRTAAVAEGFRRVKVLDLGTKRLGKSYAIMRGLQAANNDVIMTLDADLRGLTHEALSALMLPVVSGEVDVTMSMRRNSLLLYRLIGIDVLTGERVFRKDVLGDYSRLGKLTGYGIEIFFNQEVILHNRSVLVVYWRNVRSVRQQGKYGFFYGLKLELVNFKQGKKTITLPTYFHIIRKLRANSTRSRGRVAALWRS